MFLKREEKWYISVDRNCTACAESRQAKNREERDGPFWMTGVKQDFARRYGTHCGMLGQWGNGPPFVLLHMHKYCWWKVSPTSVIAWSLGIDKLMRQEGLGSWLSGRARASRYRDGPQNPPTLMCGEDDSTGSLFYTLRCLRSQITKMSIWKQEFTFQTRHPCVHAILTTSIWSSCQKLGRPNTINSIWTQTSHNLICRQTLSNGSVAHSESTSPLHLQINQN